MKDNCKCCDENEFSTCTCDHEIKPILKPGKKIKKPKKTANDKTHLNWVASQGCMICGGEACVHHIRLHGEPRNHRKTIPLCWEHHQGSDGLHTLGKNKWREKYGHELVMLEELTKRLSG